MDFLEKFLKKFDGDPGGMCGGVQNNPQIISLRIL